MTFRNSSGIFTVDLAPVVWNYARLVQWGVDGPLVVHGETPISTYSVDGAHWRGLYFLQLPEENIFGGANVEACFVPTGFRVEMFDVHAAIHYLYSIGLALPIVRTLLAYSLTYCQVGGRHLVEASLQPMGRGKIKPSLLEWAGAFSFPTIPLYTVVSHAFFGSGLAGGPLYSERLAGLLLSNALEVWDAIDHVFRADMFPFRTDTCVGKVFTGSFPDPILSKSLVQYADLYDHVASWVFGSSWFGDLFLPRQEMPPAPRFGLYDSAWPRLEVFSAPLSHFAGVPRWQEERNQGLVIRDESVLFRLFVLNHVFGHDYRRVSRFGGDIEVWSHYIPPRVARAWKFDRASVSLSLWDMALMRLGGNKSLLDYLLEMDKLSDDARELGSYVLKNNETFRSEGMSSYFGGHNFGEGYEVERRKALLSKFPWSFPANRREVEVPDFDHDDFERFFTFMRSLIHYDDIDFKVSEYRSDLFRYFWTYTRVDLPSKWVGGTWNPTSEQVEQLFKVMLEFSHVNTPFQLFTNCFVYALTCETAMIVVLHLATFGYFQLDDSGRSEFNELYDQYMIQFSKCPLTCLDLEDIEGITGSLVTLGQWGPDRTKKDHRVTTNVSCMNSLIALHNNFSDNWTKGKRHVFEYPQISYDYLFDPINQVLAGDREFEVNGEKVKGFEAAIRAQVKSMGLNPDDYQYRASIKGCLSGSTVGRDEVIQLYQHVLDDFYNVVAAEVAKRFARRHDSSEFGYVTMWLKSTPGTASLTEQSKYLKRTMKFLVEGDTLEEDQELRFQNVVNP